MIPEVAAAMALAADESDTKGALHALEISFIDSALYSAGSHPRATACSDENNH